MSEEDKIFSSHKNSEGELILEINPQNFRITLIIKWVLWILLKIFLPLFSFFDYLASKKKLVVSGVGLGIGLGLSVLVSQRPDAIQAFPTLFDSSNSPITATKLSISSIDLYSTITSGSVQDIVQGFQTESLIHDTRSAGLGEQYPVVITEVGLKNILKNLENVSIGDKINIYGSNNAEYKYTVTEIRDIKAEYLPNVIGANSESLILYKSKNLLRTQVYMLIAKPIQ